MLKLKNMKTFNIKNVYNFTKFKSENEKKN